MAVLVLDSVWEPTYTGNSAFIKWQQIVLGSMQFRAFYTTLFHGDKVIGDSINRHSHGHIVSYFGLGKLEK